MSDPCTQCKQWDDEVVASFHANCNRREHTCPCVHGCDRKVWCDCMGPLCGMCYLHSVRGCDHVPECEEP